MTQLVDDTGSPSPASFIPGQTCASPSTTRGRSPVPKSGLWICAGGAQQRASLPRYAGKLPMARRQRHRQVRTWKRSRAAQKPAFAPLSIRLNASSIGDLLVDETTRSTQ